MTPPGAHQRREVRFRGRVQGVGFRYTAARVARDFEVVGYVRNAPDGSVELVAEGAPAEVERFVNAVAEAMVDYVHDRQSHTAAASGEFSDFSVRT